MMIFTRPGWANYLSRYFDLGFTPQERKAIFFAIVHNARSIAASTRRMPKRDQVFLSAFLMRHDPATVETTARLVGKSKDEVLKLFDTLCGLVILLASENSGLWVTAVQGYRSLPEGTPFTLEFLFGDEGQPAQSPYKTWPLNLEPIRKLFESRLK